MRFTTLLEYALIAVLCVVLLSLAFGVLLGQPVLFAYVETGSMEPTIDAGDGYVAVPAALAGDVEQGDVVAFEAEEVHDGELTTHRVVDERDGGYVTQGDANPFTDQSRDEPVVTDGQIQAVALRVNGEVVTIPHLGTAAMAVGDGIDRSGGAIANVFGWQGFGSGELTYLLFGAGVLFLGASVLTGGDGRNRRESRDRDRSRSGVIDSKLVLVGCILLICAAATLAMVLPAGTETFGVVSTEGDSADPTIIPVGETDDFEYEFHNGGVVSTVSYVESESSGLDVEPERLDLSRGESANATVTLHANDETGYHVESMTEYRYLVVIPPAVIDALYAVHPWTPYLAIYVVLSAPIVAAWRFFGGSSDKMRLRTRSRSGGVSDWL